MFHEKCEKILAVAGEIIETETEKKEADVAMLKIKPDNYNNIITRNKSQFLRELGAQVTLVFHQLWDYQL